MALVLCRLISMSPLPSTMAVLVARWVVPMPEVIGIITWWALETILVDVRRTLLLLAWAELIPITAVKASGGRVSRVSRDPVPTSLPLVWSSVLVSVRPPVTR